MSALVNKETLIRKIVNTPTNSDVYNPVYLSGSAARQHEILDIISELPTTSEQEIRDKAIEEFAVAIKCTLPITINRDRSEIDYEVDCALYALRNRIDRIAEKMKEVGE